jgi:hypothetical protein
VVERAGKSLERGFFFSHRRKREGTSERLHDENEMPPFQKAFEWLFFASLVFSEAAIINSFIVIRIRAIEGAERVRESGR